MKIILSDGTEIKNLTLNATTLVADKEVPRETFAGKLDAVTFVYDDGTEEVKHNMSLDTCADYGEGWYICLSEMTESEIKEREREEEITVLQEALAEVYELII